MKSGWLLFLRFLAVGGLNTAFGYACYASLVLFGAPLWLAVGGATLLGFVFNFFSYGGLVFGRTSYVLLPRFLLFYLGIYAINFVLLEILTKFGVGPLWAQALLLPMLATAGFVVMRKFVFRGQNRGVTARGVDEAIDVQRRT
jgi:putative flippase GtrA